MSGLTRPHHFAKYLMRDGYSNVVFSSSYLHHSYENVIKGKEKYITYEEDQVKYVFVRTPPYKSNKMDRIFNIISFVKRVIKTAKNYAEKNDRPDVIIASSPHMFALLAGLRIAKKYKVPCICEVRDLWPEEVFTATKIKEKSLIGKILTGLEYWIYKRADAIVFTKEGDVDHIKECKWNIEQGGKINLDKCFYINNGVDIESFYASMNEDVLMDEDLEDEDTFKVVYTGAIRFLNNVGNIINTAVALKNYKDIKFLIYGNGSEFEEIKSRIETEKISNVVLKGYVNKKFIPYVLSKSSVNLLNYSVENYNWSRGNSSNKLFEYMASGKPIIANIKMGYCLIEKYKCGLTLEKSSPEMLAEAILKIKNLPQNEYNEICQNSKKGASDFDFKILAERLKDVIENKI